MTTKQWSFTIYYNYNFKEKDRKSVRTRDWAEAQREKTLGFLERLFENKARFSCIAKDQGVNTLTLRGYVNLNSPCKTDYIRRLLGLKLKFSNCRPSYFGDMVQLCRLLHIDRNLSVTGRLPCGNSGGNKKLKSFTGDPKIVVKVLLEAMDKDSYNKFS